ncbi:endolytic transglycosylase MltG [Peterkaempfera sp. SMS 1(5)a]|uniref:endolytic transglycosylase MltG n=1 Tax=Peterkaempfera podocarpi TaxID=3232308 RepID=UPI0036728D39
MTDLGRGYGSQPWNAGDPLYGDMPQQGGNPGGHGQQASQASQGGYGQGQQQGWPTDPYGGQQGGWQQQPQQPQYPQQQQYPGQYPQQQPQHPQQQQPQQQYPQQQQQYPGQFPPQPRRPQQQPQQPQPRPQPQQPQDEFDWQAEADALNRPAAEPDAEEEWSGEEEYAEEAGGSFFGDQDDSRGAERRRKQQGKKSGRRNGGACLVISVVLVGILGAGTYYGYGFYQDHFGPPPDFAGVGTGSVQVDIPDGATGTQMGAALKKAGVVKSVDAFVKAYNGNAKAQTIQAGFFTMKLQMSAAEAVKFLIESAGGDVLMVPEGRRASEIYAMIDAKLKLDQGTTARTAKTEVGKLGLPAWAHGNPEGFLFPARYPVGKGMKPFSLLKQMVARANEEFAKFGYADGYRKDGLKSPYELLTVASLVQAEGLNSDDFGKISQVVYNRLKPGNTETNGFLEFDSTYNYARGNRTLHVSAEEMRRYKSNINTYYTKGLPSQPISNPGEEALKAALNPTPGPWYYFVSVTPTDTRFAATLAEHQKNQQAFEEELKKSGGNG